MKKTCLLIVFLFTATIGFSQITTSTYDFEGLALAPINGQDNWEVKSSHSQVNNGSICPPVPGTELHPELFNATSSGLYTGSKALQNVNFSFALQHSIVSRVDDSSWSLPSISGKEYMILEWDFNGNHWGKGFYLGYDANGDADFSIDCSTFDTNERSIGISTSAGNTRLHDATGAIIATAPRPNEWTKYRVFIDLKANGTQGSINVCYRELSHNGNWTSMPGMQNINAGFDTSATNQTNPSNLNGMMYEQHAGGTGNLDNIQISTINFDVGDTSVCNASSVTIGQALNGASYLWNNGVTLPVISATFSDVYYVDVTLAECITFRKYISVTLQPTQIDLGIDTLICNGSSLPLDAGPHYSSYQWSNGDTTQTILADTAGVYIVDAMFTGTPGIELIMNGNFSSGGAHWNHCGNNTEAYAPETTYGGTNSSNTNVAEIDAGSDGIAGTPDDFYLCQSITGLQVGQNYTLCFNYSRRNIGPNPMDMIVTIDGGALTQTIVATNAVFGFTQACFSFTATQSTHLLSFTPGPSIVNGLGIIVDDISIPIASRIRMSCFRYHRAIHSNNRSGYLCDRSNL
jgi:hypothetical protein